MDLKGSVVKASRAARGLVSQEARLEAMVGPPGVWKPARDFQRAFLLQKGLQPAMRVLDVGCGPLRGGIELIKYLDPGRYVGVDVRSEVIDEAHRQVAGQKLGDKNAILITSSHFGREIVLDGSIDVVWAYSVLIHFTDDLVTEFLDQVSRYLTQSGVAYANINAVTSPERGQWKEFPFVQRPVEFYGDAATKFGLHTEDLGSLASLGFTAPPGKPNTNTMLQFCSDGSNEGSY